MTAPKRRFALSALNQRRWGNFRANKRAFWSLVILGTLYVVSLFAEFIANDRPIIVNYQGAYYFPIGNFYAETTFGGDFRTEAQYTDPVVQCLIRAGGSDFCFDDPAEATAQAETGIVDGAEITPGWMVWPPIPYSYDTVNDIGRAAPSPPDDRHLLGTDDTARDVLARVIYGFRLSISFAIVVTVLSSVIGVAAGAVQGYFGGVLDLLFQRVIELWNSVPSIYIIIIISSMVAMNFWLLVFLMTLFGWTGLVGVVRAEFLRALTFLPFIITGVIGSLAALDFLGFGLPSSAPSLGELTLQAKNNLQAPWLGFSAFFTFAIMLSLLVFIFEGVRDAFDPRKTFK
ncbi:MAG: ABC transporter permease subunit [Alphaproteobacteria bacterium]|nr:ABC transporter permease subunit [Alphaproteobacteria bacterium]